MSFPLVTIKKRTKTIPARNQQAVSLCRRWPIFVMAQRWTRAKWEVSSLRTRKQNFNVMWMTLRRRGMDKRPFKQVHRDGLTATPISKTPWIERVSKKIIV